MAVLIVGLYHLFQPEEPIAATSAIDKQRAAKIGDHRIDSTNYLNKIDTFHKKNSSLQTVMESRGLLPTALTPASDSYCERIS